MRLSSCFLAALLLFVVSPAKADSGIVFPPTHSERCASGAGVLSWTGSGDVACRTIPPSSCPSGQVVLVNSNGLYCGSPVGACASGQLLSAVNVGNDVAFSCTDVTSRVSVSCATGEVLQGISNGTPICVPISSLEATTSTTAACGTHSSGETWTESCDSGQSGSITSLCTNGVVSVTSNTCANTNCGTHADGEQWVESCPASSNSAVTQVVGSVKKLCTKGTTSTVSDTCTQIVRCVNRVCSGTGPAVFFPTVNGAGFRGSSDGNKTAATGLPVSCVGGQWYVDVAGTNWSDGQGGQSMSYCSGGAMTVAGNCGSPAGGSFSGCPLTTTPSQSTVTCKKGTYCRGYNSRVNYYENSSSTTTKQVTCTGVWEMDARTNPYWGKCRGTYTWN